MFIVLDIFDKSNNKLLYHRSKNDILLYTALGNARPVKMLINIYIEGIVITTNNRNIDLNYLLTFHR